jgi:hypothetical protein
MTVVEELEEILTPDQAHRLADSHLVSVAEKASPTQQLLDELLGRFEEDDSPVFVAQGLTTELYADSDD